MKKIFVFLLGFLCFPVMAQTADDFCHIDHVNAPTSLTNLSSYEVDLCGEGLINAYFRVQNSLQKDLFVDFNITYVKKPGYKNEDTVYFPHEENIQGCDQTDGPYLCLKAERPTSSPWQDHLTMQIMVKVKVQQEGTNFVNPRLISLWTKYLPAK